MKMATPRVWAMFWNRLMARRWLGQVRFWIGSWWLSGTVEFLMGFGGVLSRLESGRASGPCGLADRYWGVSRLRFLIGWLPVSV
jgi:hypothetical protein